jgi:hypothetical protein
MPAKPNEKGKCERARDEMTRGEMATRVVKAVSGEIPRKKMERRSNKFSFTIPAANSVLVFRRGTVSRLGAVRSAGQISKSNISSTLLGSRFGHLPAISSCEQRHGTEIPIMQTATQYEFVAATRGKRVGELAGGRWRGERIGGSHGPPLAGCTTVPPTVVPQLFPQNPANNPRAPRNRPLAVARRSFLPSVASSE